MGRVKNIKIILSIIYISLICIFLWFFFKYFSIEDFTSYDLIKKNQSTLNQLKDGNIFLLSIIFFIFCCIWCLLLGFGSPIFLIGGFVFGKWVGSILVIFGLTTGATLLYLLGNYFLKDYINEKFSNRFIFLITKFKKNEFIYFVIYRAIGGIPFFLQNLIPIIFNINLRVYFFGTLIGISVQNFIGVSLGAGINKVIENNSDPPSMVEIIQAPDIYLPILAFIIIFIIGFIFRKKFFRSESDSQ